MMARFRAVLGLGVLMVSCVIHLAGQQPNVTFVGAKNSQAIRILQQSLAAMNSNAAAALDTLAQGTVTFADGTSASVTIETRGATLFRNSLDFGSSSITTIVNNGDGYRIENGVRQTLPLHTTLYSRVEYIPAFSRATEYLNPATNLSYIGVESLGGAQVHHIQITTLPNSPSPTAIQAEALNSEFHVFIDTSSNLIVMTRSFLFSPLAIENRFPIDTVYSDFRHVHGVTVPFHITRLYQGSTYSDLQLANVQVGVGLNSTTDFQ
jgi:hypothetical protein